MRKNRILLSIITVIKEENERFKLTLNSLKNFYANSNFEYLVIEKITKNINSDIFCFLKTDRLIKYFNDNESHNGIYNAMNMGIDKANGEYILFLNAGDKLLFTVEDLITTIENIKKKSKRSKVILLNSLISLGNKKFLLKPKLNFRIKMPTSHQAIIFKSDFLKKNKFNLNYKVAADYNMLTSIKREDFIILKNRKPFTEIEYSGYSSRYYIRSYFEYLKIIYLNKKGFVRLFGLGYILLNLFCVFILKQFLNTRLIFEIKKFKSK